METTTTTHVTEGLRATEIGAGHLYVLPTPVRDVVTIRGSMRTHPDFEAGDDLLQSLTVAMLDKGTQRRDRFAVAEALERRGARLSFSNNGLRVRFSGRALRGDLDEVLALASEQLREPLLDAAEFEKARAQVAAARQRALESTASQAGGALARRLYAPAHPNYAPSPEEELEQLARYTPADVEAYHARHFGAADLLVVLAGDADAGRAEAAAQAAFGDWAAPAATAAFETAASPEVPGRTDVPMPDKANADVRIGHALRLRRDAPDYLPLYLATYVLGGNFSARLMTVIRDEMGLTYGTGARLAGVTVDHDGHWRVGVTLSQENLEQGVEATLGEIRRFVEGGITEDELDEKKTTLTGGFQVGLATTGGLAASLLMNLERGFGPDYLDRYVGLIEGITLEEANGAIRRHLRADALHIAAAGGLG